VRSSLWPAAILALLLPSAGAWAVSSGCGNELVIRERSSDEGGGGSDPGTGGGGVEIAAMSSGGDAGPDGFDAWVDPPCEDTPPPIEDFACDPYDQDNGDCLDGEGCFIFVEYPPDVCSQEIFGSVCLPEGPGEQGDSCAGPTDCQGGYVCVVTGSGNQCVEFCNLEGESGCPPGLVCEPIDVEGFGGCL
jgi:hypothetical protein